MINSRFSFLWGKAEEMESNGTVSVVYGPLTFSLEIKRITHVMGTDKWPAYDLTPDSPWNYGLVLDREKPDDSFGPIIFPPSDKSEPLFSPKSKSWVLAKARRIPAWTLDKRGLVNEIAAGPFKSNEKVETITLIPMGCCRLRITAFPVIDNDKGKVWPPPVKPKYTASARTASRTTRRCPMRRRRAQELERSRHRPFHLLAAERQHGVGAVRLRKPMTLSRASVYWFDDTPGGGCKLPKSWRLLYKEGKDWKPVADASEYVIAKDKFCDVKFKEVTTPALRLEVQLEKDFSGGILEWRVK